jgi:hypothetical protein
MRSVPARLSNSLRAAPEEWDATGRATAVVLHTHPARTGGIRPATAPDRKLCCPVPAHTASGHAKV